MAISFHGAKRYKKHNGSPESAAIREPIASPVHFYPLKQANGLLLTPTVSIGDKVLRGQKIADLDAFAALPVISGVSGTVLSVTDSVISVENDMMMTSLPTSPVGKTYDELTMREILWIMRESGIYEIRSAKPAHVVLSEGKTPECVIVCCFDSDPYVSSPQAAANKNAEKVLDGLGAALRVLGVKKAIVAVQNDTKKTYYDFKYRLRYNTDVSLYCLKARYPQSRSDILIKTLTGKAETNALILSAETLINISDALNFGKRVTDKIVTVSGDDILPPDNFIVPLGATAASLIESAGYSSPQAVFEGGIIEGHKMSDLNEPVSACSCAFTAFNDVKNIPKCRKEPI